MIRFLICLTVTLFSLLSKAQSLTWEAQIVQSANANTKLTPLNKNVSHSVYVLGFTIPSAYLVKGLVARDSIAIGRAWRMGLAGAGNLVITYLLKESIKRQRPFERYTEIHAYDSFAHGFSMPSGHSATAFNLASSLSLEFPKWYIILPSYAYAAWVAYSRIQLGVHYPSDVFIGALTGTGMAWLSRKIQYRWLGNMQLRNKKINY
jgi:membrane-associated phospholipid phosphatase